MRNSDIPFNESAVAVISDIHGNRWALEAVLADIRERGIEDIVNLGDSLYGPLAPAETAEILLDLNLPTVRGNEDWIILNGADQSSCSPTVQYVRGHLRQKHLDWLSTLKTTEVAFETLLLFHGSPDVEDEYLLREVTGDGVHPIEPDRLMTRLEPVTQPVILCGHDHSPHSVRLPDNRLIVNPGSVGLQAYTDDVPYPHIMETGTPDARYSIVQKKNANWQTENIIVEYDRESAALRASANGREDWARWLRTGRAME